MTKNERKKPFQYNYLEEITVNKKENSTNIIIGIIVATTLICLLFYILSSTKISNIAKVGVFNTVFISILMQAFPFMLIGVLVSSVMHVFIPDEWIIKIFPTKYGLGFLTAMFAGVFFPICECAIVPVMTRLVKKGVAMPIAITFMLSAPIINPIVIISTLYAFPGQPEITLMRVSFGLLIALLVGLCMLVYGKNLPMLLEDADILECCCNDNTLHKCACNVHNDHPNIKYELVEKLKELFLHTGDEFFKVGKFLVIGACITSLIQTLVSKEVFTNLDTKSWLSLLVMMTMAFLFSACSTSDAFIARSFMNVFSTGAIMGFMVFGPMMDLKNLLMLLSSFKKSFVIRLTLIIIILNVIVLNFLNFLFL